MLLHIMRHGPAEDRAPTGRDFDRVLTSAGRGVVEKAAHLLSLGARPRLLASPYRRAQETAEIVAASAVPPLDVEEHGDLAADEGMPLALVQALATAGADAILVGHQPTVEELTRELVGRPAAPLRAGFRTAMIVTLEWAADTWRLVRVLDPHAD
jgi:phosphohistidine phosphatase